MSIQSVLLPLFAEVALVFAICLMLVFAGRGGDPARRTRLNDSLRNQFEIPVLFFALVPLAILTRQADYLFVVMSWILVASRIAHAAVHTTSNRQPARGLLWALGLATLIVMWIVFAFRILFPPGFAP